MAPQVEIEFSLQSGQEGLDVVGSVNQEGDGDYVSDYISGRLESRSVVAVCATWS